LKKISQDTIKLWAKGLQRYRMSRNKMEQAREPTLWSSRRCVTSSTCGRRWCNVSQNY